MAVDTSAFGLALGGLLCVGLLAFLAEAVEEKVAPLLFGSGVSAGNPSPALEKYRAELKDRHPYPWPNPLFIYYGVREHGVEKVFEKNIDFIAKHIQPYAPEAIAAGCTLDHGNTIFRGEEGPKDLSMARPFNIHSLKRQVEFLRGKGIVTARHLSLKAAFASQLPDDYKERGWVTRKPFKQWLDGQIEADRKTELVYLEHANPEVRQWVEDTFDHLTHEVGFRYLWLDNYHPALNEQQVREMYLAVRRGAERHGHRVALRPGATVSCLGVTEVYAPGPDVQHTWASFQAVFNWRVPATFPPFQKYVYTMGLDDFYVNQPFNTDQARFVCSMFGIAGIEITETEGEFYKTPPQRLRMLQKILPLPMVEPLEFQPRVRRLEGERKGQWSEPPGAWALKLVRTFETWHVVGFFNPELFESKERELDFSHLGLEEGPYLAWDFWEERFLGRFSERLKVRLGPASCLIVALRKATGAPQVLSTDRHITQGGVEIEECRWSKEEHTLEGEFHRGVKGRQFWLVVYVPANYTFEQATGDVATVESVSPHVLRVRLSDGENLRWSLRFGTSDERVEEGFSDGVVVANASAEVVGDINMALTEWWVKVGAPEAGLERELEGGEGWQPSGNDIPEGAKNLWYRTRVSIPERWKGSSLRLYSAGRSRFQAWVNGTKCPPVLNPARNYTHYIADSASALPVEAINFGGENVLILQHANGGGEPTVGLQIDLDR